MSSVGELGRVAYLTSEYPAISHTFILREVKALRALGIEVTTCSIRKPRELFPEGGDESRESADTFYVLDAARSLPLRAISAHLRLLATRPGSYLRTMRLAWKTARPGARAALWQMFYLIEAVTLSDHLLRIGAGHLHNHFGNSSCTVAMLASALAGIPYSFTVHGPDEFFRPNELALAHKIAGARFVVAISQFCRSQLMLFSEPDHWAKIAIVHCGIEPARYGRSSRADFAKRIIYVARLTPTKGGRLLLDAFAQAHARHPDATLTIVGDGPERAALEAQARCLGLADAVTFAGFQTQEQVIAHLDAADVLVLPSFAEGVPVVLMEAMAARLPTVASLVAGVPELVRDGETGFVISPGDIASLADRLDRLLSDPDLCRSMGAAGRAVVEAEFNAAHEAEKLAALFAGEPPGRDRPGGMPEPPPPGSA